MKKLIILITIYIFSFIYLNAASIKLDDNLSINEVKPGLFIIIDTYLWSSNSLISVMENGDILIVDTPYTPKATDLLLNWIKKSYGKRNITAVNTHFHIDRLGGNEALVKAGIPVYGSELTVKAIRERGQRSLDLMISMMNDPELRQEFRNFKYVMPTKIFDPAKGLTLNFGNEKAEVKFYGTGHSVDNLVVYLPEKKTIFGGCMIFPLDAKTAGNVSDGNIDEWKMAMEKIDTKNYDLVIPGHGREGGLELLKHTKNILENSK